MKPKTVISCTVLHTVLLFTQFAESAHSIKGLHTSFYNDPASEVTVSWRTAPGVNGTRLEYGVTSEHGTTQNMIETVASGDSEDPGINNHVRLTNLRPDTRYYYRCGSPTIGWSSGSFRTAPAPDHNAQFTWAVVGDIQGRDSSAAMRELADWLATRDVAFWIPVGDLVEGDGLDQSYWDALFANGNPLFRNTVIMPVIGNHDQPTRHGSSPRLYSDQFRVPYCGTNTYGYTFKNGTLSDYSNRWYSFEYANANFVVLDYYPFNEVDPDGNNYNDVMKTVQRGFMENNLKNSTAIWQFVFWHPPVFSTGGHGGDTLQWITDNWVPVYAGRAHVVFTGHTHMYEITHPIKEHNFTIPNEPVITPVIINSNRNTTVSTSDGTIYYNTAGINTTLGPVRPSQKWTLDRVEKTDTNRYLVTLVTVSSNRTTIATWNYHTNTLRHKYVINR